MSAEACRVPGTEVRTASTSLAKLAAMRRASSRVSWDPASDCLHTAKKC